METIEIQKKLSEQKEDPIIRYSRSGGHALLVTGNFKDYRIEDNKLYYTPHFNYQKLSEQGSAVLIYSSSGGLQIFNRNELSKKKSSFINELLGRYGLKEFRTSLNEEAIHVFREFEQILLRRQPYPIALVLDYVEHIAPNPQLGGNTDEKIIAAETIHKLVNNPQLRNSGNLLIAIARDGLYNPLLDDLEHIEYLLPDEHDTTLFSKVIQKKISEGDNRYAPLAKGFSPETFGRLTKGLKLKDCEDIFTEANLRQQAVDRKLVLEIKQKAILKNSENTLTLVDTKYGFDQIIGHEAAKREIKKETELLKHGDRRAARGIMLIGPPGTGKTLFAEAIAHEAEVAFLKYNLIKNMYVGESERLEELAEKIIKAVSPCVVFMDDLDLTSPNRETSQNNDGGVTNNIEQKRYAFMSQEENRGNIMFIGATNHIENLDYAMISRFSKKFPILLPPADEIPEYLKKYQIESTGEDNLDLYDPRILEAANIFWNKGANPRIIRDFVSSIDFTPDNILSVAKCYTGNAKRKDDIRTELQSCEMTENKANYDWFSNLSGYNFNWYFKGLVDLSTGDYDKVKSAELRLRL